MLMVVMPGDGIGPEITSATLTVLREVDRRLALGITFEHAAIGFEALRVSGTTLPDAVVEVAKRADGVILGPVSHNAYPPVAQGGLNPSGELRRRLDLYAMRRRRFRQQSKISRHRSVCHSEKNRRGILASTQSTLSAPT